MVPTKDASARIAWSPGPPGSRTDDLPAAEYAAVPMALSDTDLLGGPS